MPEFACYRKNILGNYGVKSESITYAKDNIIEAALAYWKTKGYWPDVVELVDSEKPEPFNAIEAMRQRLSYIEQQRDNFANSVSRAEQGRAEVYSRIEKLHDAIRAALAEVNVKVKENS